MNPELAAAAAPSNPSTTSQQLRGPVLMIARVLWAGLFGLALLVFGLSLYTYYLGHSSLACVNLAIPEYAPTCIAFQDAIRGWGLSVDGYAGYFLAVQVLAGAPYFVVGAVMAWRRPSELRVLLFSAWLAALAAAGTWFNPIWEWMQDERFNPLYTHWYASSFLFAIAIGLAVFRYRLWDVDVVINRALVYGALTFTVIGVYVLIVGLLGAMAQSNLNWLASILATGLIAVLVQPLHDRLQSAVNRLMYGERDDPVSVLNRLGARLEATLAPEAVLPVLAETVGQALKLPYVAIKLDGAIAAEFPSGGAPTTTAPLEIPLKHQFETIGALLIAPRAPGEPFSPLDQHLLENIARQAGMAAHAVSLTQALQRARQSLVTAREEERRRLRRDLHDGLGPALASQGLKLAAAKQLLQHDPAAAAPLLDEVMAQTQATVGDVRRLVYGLRPPALDERGLAEAIRDHVTQSPTSGLRVDVGDLPREMPALPAAVEVAAYRIALEALTNVIRHAQAQHCSIQFNLERHALRIEITDDGRGLPPELRAGVGLRSMRERAEELGGTLTVKAVPNGGTQASATLPLGERKTAE